MKILSFLIERNQKIGIAGPSGSGKSTLAKIFLGLDKIQCDKFTIGQLDYYDIKHEEILGKITMVLQESELFNLSMFEKNTMMRNINHT